MKAGSHEGDQAGHVGFVLVPLPKSPMTAKDTSATVGVGVLALGRWWSGACLRSGVGLSAALQFRREPKSANPVTTRTMVAAISAMVSRERPGHGALGHGMGCGRGPAGGVEPLAGPLDFCPCLPAPLVSS